jgi:hypothetical protein
MEEGTTSKMQSMHNWERKIQFDVFLSWYG